jgi:hypothetical protein
LPPPPLEIVTSARDRWSAAGCAAPRPKCISVCNHLLDHLEFADRLAGIVRVRVVDRSAGTPRSARSSQKLAALRAG